MKKNKIIIIIFILAFIFISCKHEQAKNNEIGAAEFEVYLSRLIAGGDILEFSSIFAEPPDINTLKSLKNMNFIFTYSRSEIIESLKGYGVIYRRIFSEEDGSVKSYLPKDGGYYNVTVTYKLFEDTHIALIEYGDNTVPYINAVQFVAIYQNNKWRLLTVNFMNISE